MSTDENKQLTKEEINKNCSANPVIDENATAHMMQIFGSQAQQYMPTQAQVDKILALQEKGMDYTHKERTEYSPKQKTELTMFIIVLFVMLIIFILSLFFAKEYLGEIISGTVGFLAGGAGGYGVATRFKTLNNGNE